MVIPLPPGSHLCLLYDDLHQLYPEVLAFGRDGLSQGEQVYYVADERSADDWRFELHAGGIDVDREEAKGSLIVCEGEHWRSPQPFSSIRNARAAWELVESGLEEFGGVRFAVDMGWTLDPPVPHDLLCHWEATLNVLNSDVNVRTMCLYNVRRHSAVSIHSALRTHPIVMVSGRCVRNPYYEAERILENEPHLNHSIADASMVEGLLLSLTRLPELRRT